MMLTTLIGTGLILNDRRARGCPDRGVPRLVVVLVPRVQRHDLALGSEGGVRLSLVHRRAASCELYGVQRCLHAGPLAVNFMVCKDVYK